MNTEPLTNSERLHLLADLMQSDLAERRKNNRFVVGLYSVEGVRERAQLAETEERHGKQIDLAARLSIEASPVVWENMHPDDRQSARDRVVALLDAGAVIDGVADDES